MLAMPWKLLSGLMEGSLHRKEIIALLTCEYYVSSLNLGATQAEFEPWRTYLVPLWQWKRHRFWMAQSGPNSPSRSPGSQTQETNRIFIQKPLFFYHISVSFGRFQIKFHCQIPWWKSKKPFICPIYLQDVDLEVQLDVLALFLRILSLIKSAHQFF